MSPNLEVRLTAGEALATVFELGREFNPDFADEIVPELVVVLNQLATDSQKHRARKDRKQQRATFRDILHFIRVSYFLVIGVLEKKMVNLNVCLSCFLTKSNTNVFHIRQKLHLKTNQFIF